MSQLALTIVIVCLVIDAVLLVALWLLLRWRKVSVYLTRFGPALVFDGSDEDGDAIRLLNVNGTFQSVSYVLPSSDGAGAEPGAEATDGKNVAAGAGVAGAPSDARLFDGGPTDQRFELVCAYHQYFAEVIDMLGPGGTGGCCALDDVLVVGGGGFSLPKWLVAHCPRARVDVAEIDPKVIDIARRHFFLSELEARFHAEERGRLVVRCTDGWDWLASGDRRWRLIVNDAFRARRPLGALTGADGARTIRAHLLPGGAYLANLLCPLEGRSSDVLHQTIKAFAAEFAHVYLFPEWPDDPRRGGANAFVATDLRLPVRDVYEVRVR
ncbi:spermidine synthase [Olsenella massiliensis]|uniref:spermidine synthase n=1 Tax=Olsenella massiliensis TaxID=1622075 RepID=UPI00071CF456|nr:fused MFS/spermidine synthase [Olsenella massiliensis]